MRMAERIGADDSRFTSSSAREISPLSTGTVSGVRARRIRASHQVFDAELCQREREDALRIGHCGKHDVIENARTRHRTLVLDGPGGAQHVGDADALLLARERIAAARSAYTVEDTLVNQRLQHGLQMPWGKI